MIEKEIRKNVKNKKGEINEKLIFKVLVQEESTKISVKQKSFIEPVLIDLEEIIGTCIHPTIMKFIKKSIYFYYKDTKDIAPQ